MVDDEADGTINVLVLTELSTNCVGCVIVGQETRTVKNQIGKWLDHFGIASSTSSVVLHTDAERAVSELVGNSSDKIPFWFAVHDLNNIKAMEVLNIAERAVRRLKESLAVLRAEMNQGGADVCFTERGLHDVVTYIALSHNHFSKAHGTDFLLWNTPHSASCLDLPLQCLDKVSLPSCPVVCEPNHPMRPEALKLLLCTQAWILASGARCIQN